MKKIIKVTILMTLMGIGTLKGITGIGVGVQGGVNMANVYGDYVDSLKQSIDIENQIAPVIGVNVCKKFMPFLGMQLELYALSGKGYKMETSFLGTKVEGKLKISYFEVAPLIKVHPPMPGSPVKVGLLVGPYFDILEKGETEMKIADSTSTEEVTDSLKTSDYGITVGPWIKFKVAPLVSFEISGRYWMGFSKIDKDDVDDIKNKGFSIIAGVKFSL